MLASVLVEPGRLETRDVAIPDISEGEVLVRMLRGSICGSDLHIVFGTPSPQTFGRPGAPGHEGVGEIVRSRSSQFDAGQLVLTVPPGGQGQCFAEYVAIDDGHVVPLPEAADADRLVAAQQLGTTVWALRKFWSGAGTGTATVIGAGSAGLFFLQQLRMLGFEQVVVSDLDEDRLAVAKRLGADVTVRAPEESIVDATMEATGGAGADLVVEAVGHDSNRADAVHAAKRWGRLGFFGLPEQSGLAPFPTSVAFRKALQIDFSDSAQSEPGLHSFRQAVQLIADGRVEVDYCMQRSFPLIEITEAFAHAVLRGSDVKTGVYIAD